MVNSAKLRGRIIEKGYNNGEFADALDVSRVTLRKKIYGVRDFTASEIVKICDLLDISRSEMPDYFFAQAVGKTET